MLIFIVKNGIIGIVVVLMAKFTHKGLPMNMKDKLLLLGILISGPVQLFTMSEKEVIEAENRAYDKMLEQYGTECSPTWSHWATYYQTDKNRCTLLFNLLSHKSQEIRNESDYKVYRNEHWQYLPYFKYWLPAEEAKENAFKLMLEETD